MFFIAIMFFVAKTPSLSLFFLNSFVYYSKKITMPLSKAHACSLFIASLLFPSPGDGDAHCAQFQAVSLVRDNIMFMVW